MAEIHNFDNESDSITCIISGVTGLDVQVNVACEYDPGQPYKAPSRRDILGQAYFPEAVTDIETTVYIGVVDGEDDFLTAELDKEQKAEIAQAIIEYRNEARL